MMLELVIMMWYIVKSRYEYACETRIWILMPNYPGIKDSCKYRIQVDGTGPKSKSGYCCYLQDH